MKNNSGWLFAAIVCQFLLGSAVITAGPELPVEEVSFPYLRAQSVIGKTMAESKPYWDKPVKGKPGSPNIFIILLDDVGFADFGLFGSEIKTPNIDQLAETCEYQYPKITRCHFPLQAP